MVAASIRMGRIRHHAAILVAVGLLAATAGLGGARSVHAEEHCLVGSPASCQRLTANGPIQPNGAAAPSVASPAGTPLGPASAAIAGSTAAASIGSPAGSDATPAATVNGTMPSAAFGQDGSFMWLNTDAPCTAAETVVGPIAAPGAPFPRSVALFILTTGATGSFTVCQVGTTLQVRGPAGAELTISRGGVPKTIMLDGSGSGAIGTALFPQ